MKVQDLLLNLAVAGLLTALTFEVAGVSLGVDLPAMAGLVLGVSVTGVVHIAMVPFHRPEG